MKDWTRWHPRDPVFKPSKICGWSDIREIIDRAKSFNDPSTKEGDIVHDKRRDIQVLRTKFPCTECTFASITRIGLALHLMKEHQERRLEALAISKNREAVEVPEVFADADIYYEVIRPRKILSKPQSPEVDLRFDPSKGTKNPTPFEREKYDQEMKKWREDMKTAPREDFLERLPNGTFNERGDSPNWWYFYPQVWRDEAYGKGAWVEPTEDEYLNWKAVKLPKRVLYLLWIIPDSI